jgi:hypothetical protein
MPLREGSSNEVIRDNIRCILEKDGCGYDPPYKDPAREEYTPQQAAAIAYAKAGKRKGHVEKQKQKASKATVANASEHVAVPDGWRLPDSPMGVDSEWNKNKKKNLANQDKSKLLDSEVNP